MTYKQFINKIYFDLLNHRLLTYELLKNAIYNLDEEKMLIYLPKSYRFKRKFLLKLFKETISFYNINHVKKQILNKHASKNSQIHGKCLLKITAYEGYKKNLMILAKIIAKNKKFFFNKFGDAIISYHVVNISNPNAAVKYINEKQVRKKYSKKAYVSVLPSDFVTMSFGSNSDLTNIWSSCYKFYETNRPFSSYIFDTATIIAYTEFDRNSKRDKYNKLKICIASTSPEMVFMNEYKKIIDYNKSTKTLRQLMHVSPDFNTVIGSRLYPQTERELGDKTDVFVVPFTKMLGLKLVDGVNARYKQTYIIRGHEYVDTNFQSGIICNYYTKDGNKNLDALKQIFISDYGLKLTTRNFELKKEESTINKINIDRACGVLNKHKKTIIEKFGSALITDIIMYNFYISSNKPNNKLKSIDYKKNKQVSYRELKKVLKTYIPK